MTTRHTSPHESFADDLGVVDRGGEDGTARIALDVAQRHLNPAGYLHGGVVAALLDIAMARAVDHAFPDEKPVTIEMKVNYLDPGRGGHVEASASVTRRGRTVTVVEAEVTDTSTGTELAVSLGTYATVTPG